MTGVYWAAVFLSFIVMNISRHPGETNVPAIILSTAVLIVAIAAAYYMIAVLPYQGGTDAANDAASSSSLSSVMISSSAPVSSKTAQSSPSSTFNQASYDACLNAATEAHNLRWSVACTQHRETQESAYLACVNQGRGEEYCKAQFGGYEEIDANCVLPLARTNALNAQYALSKEVCDREHGR